MNKNITPLVLTLALSLMTSNLKAQDTIDTYKYQIAVISVIDNYSAYTEKRDFDSEPLVSVDELPQFVEGEEAMFRYITENVIYPVIAAENEMEGTVVVRVIVNKDGTFRNAKIHQSVALVLDKEALRIVKSMPRWIPAKKDGVNVDAYLDIPISFKLN